MTNQVTRYVIKLKNGSYMQQNMLNGEKVRLIGVDLPIDADMFKLESLAKRIIEDIDNGTTNLEVEFEPDLEPVSVESYTINYYENVNEPIIYEWRLDKENGKEKWKWVRKNED
ncbi:hypothetical protein [Shouchella clausii]|uniref:hypothetical protein n=1 Tax=Shouchella clausii TaxID=79880 RepID=UPI001C732D25|nr:hypothetical protein [Shouchella clausii]MBX0320276.1 hypothetical protein [Shouchella clausii]MEB5480959.1 hypothetical protein [Shouchella clausii]